MQGKIDDFFSRVRLVAFDGRSQEQLNKPVSSLESLGSADLSSACDEVKHFPLALVSADARLPLVDGINPAWQAAMADFAAQVVAPLLGKDVTQLDYSQWQGLKAAFNAYEQWLAAEKGASLKGICADELRGWADPKWQAALDDLMQKDLAMAPAVKAFADVKNPPAAAEPEKTLE